MLRLIRLLTFASLMVGALGISAYSQGVPDSIGFQGLLTDPAGQPVADGTYSVVFKIYNVPDGPNAALFTSAAVNVTTQGGLFAASIPDVPAASLGPDNRWLETVVAGETLSPRAELVSVPFALHADQLDGLDSTAFLQAIPVPLVLSAQASFGGSIISGTNESPMLDSIGVLGRGSSTAVGAASIGVKGQSDGPGGTGVFGHATATNGAGYGGRFISDAGLGTGVLGVGSAGVIGSSGGPAGIGVGGLAVNDTTSSTTYGGHFISHAAKGVGVKGIAHHTSGVNYGGYFETSSPAGYAGYFVGDILSEGSLRSLSPSGTAEAFLGWGADAAANEMARIRIGGGGLGASNGLDIQGPANVSLMRIHGNGNVGIGTTTPSMPLQITKGEPVIILQDTGTASTQSGYLGFWNNNPTETAWVGFGTPGNTNFSVLNTRGNIILSPAATGNVGINTSAPTFKLHVNGSVAGVGAYNNVSDGRVKRDIKPISGALDKVAKLHGVSFDWKRTQYPDIDFPQGRQIGVIGQDVAKVLPECVTRDDKGYISVAYGSLVPVLLEAIKEQQQQIESIKADNKRLQDQQQQIEAMRTDNKRLEAKLQELETLKSQMAALIEALANGPRLSSTAALPK